MEYSEPLFGLQKRLFIHEFSTAFEDRRGHRRISRLEYHYGIIEARDEETGKVCKKTVKQSVKYRVALYPKDLA